jgi:hypothetical protein
MDPTTGRYIYTWGREGMDSAEKAARDELERAGFRIKSSELAPQRNLPNDPGASWIFRGEDGEKYTLGSDGTNLYYLQVIDDEWTRVPPRIPKQPGPRYPYKPGEALELGPYSNRPGGKAPPPVRWRKSDE